MKNNSTLQPAHEYDANIAKTIPYYNWMQEEIIELVKIINPQPAAWLDAGCGTGLLARKAAQAFPKACFTLLDPSPAMLNIAQEKFANNSVSRMAYDCRGSEAADYPSESFDVITAILAHHYFDPAGRRAATDNCFRMLKSGGVYITFETILPDSGEARQIGLTRWRTAQLNSGKDLPTIERHLGRYGTELLPITAGEHIQLLKTAGFKTVEILWRSGLQMGFYAIKN